MLPRSICGRIKGWYMISTFFARYYGQTPCPTAFDGPSSDRTTTPLRYSFRCQAAAACSDGLARPSEAFCRRDCGDCLPQPRYRRARPQTLSPRWGRRPPTTQSAWAGAYCDARVESRTPAGDRPRPAYGGRLQCQLEHQPPGDLSGDQDPHNRHRRDGALVSTGGGLCLQAPYLDPQTQSPRAARLRGKRLRVEVILAGAGTPTPPPVTVLVEPDLLEEVPPDLDELLRLLPYADVYFQDDVQYAFPTPLRPRESW